MTERKFFKTVIKVEILSEDYPYGHDVSLADIDHAITEGHCSGVVLLESEVEVNSKEMAGLLLSQGNEPKFFMLGHGGNEADN